MSKKKNIDRLFQERFKDFEATPPMAAWDKIEKELDGKKPVATLPRWLKWVSIAASIALLATLAYTSYSSIINNQEVHDQIVTDTLNEELENETDINTTTTSNPVNEQPVNSDKNNDLVNTVDQELNPKGNKVVTSTNETLNTTQKSSSPNLKTTNAQNYKSATLVNSSSQESVATSDKNSQPSISYTKSSDNVSPVISQSQSQPEIALAQNKSLDNSRSQNHNNNQNTTPQSPAEKLKDPVHKNPELNHALPTKTDIANLEKSKDSTLQGKSLLDDIAQLKEEEEKTDALPFKKWNASSVLAPVFSNTIGGSSIDQQFVDNNKSAGVNLSYGVNVGYNITPRLSVRTGVHNVNMSYTTNDIIYGVEVQPGDIQLLSVDSFNRSAVSNPGNISTDNLGSSFSQEFLTDNTFNGFQGEISQRLGYLEVPLEVKYKLLDSKFSINVMGGLSALFLTENSIAVTNTTSKLELGEDDNFNGFNQSANFGLGIDYLFTDQLGITIEPMFKYQLNALRENAANFRPYNVGVYSGITYTF